MKQTTLTILLAAGIAAAAPASPALAALSPGMMPGVLVGSPPDPGSLPEVPDRDAMFMDRAAQSNMEEIMLGMLAQEKGQSAEVKKYGEQMVKDHTNAAAKQIRLAHRLGLTLPMMLTPEQQARAERLQGLEGAAFDRAYAQAMVEAHAEALALFREEARKGYDPEVRHFAAMILPVLQRHYEHARTLAPREQTPRSMR